MIDPGIEWTEKPTAAGHSAEVSGHLGEEVKPSLPCEQAILNSYRVALALSIGEALQGRVDINVQENEDPVEGDSQTSGLPRGGPLC